MGPAQLALAETEASAVLAMAGARLPDDSVRAGTRTEGWAAGVYLAALSVRGSPDAADAARQVTGSHVFIADYFREEVLTRESAESARFLLRTAALDQISGPLCDAVLGRTGSAVRLAEIGSCNLFVVPQDRDGMWYRYHRLVGEMLLWELRRREPGEESRLQRRAAAWYDEHDVPEQAVAYALAARDTATAARLVTTYRPRLVDDGRLHTVRGPRTDTSRFIPRECLSIRRVETLSR